VLPYLEKEEHHQQTGWPWTTHLAVNQDLLVARTRWGEKTVNQAELLDLRGFTLRLNLLSFHIDLDLAHAILSFWIVVFLLSDTALNDKVHEFIEGGEVVNNMGVGEVGYIDIQIFDLLVAREHILDNISDVTDMSDSHVTDYVFLGGVVGVSQVDAFRNDLWGVELLADLAGVEGKVLRWLDEARLEDLGLLSLLDAWLHQERVVLGQAEEGIFEKVHLSVNALLPEGLDQ
jgi:hypothetical protein